MEYEKIRGQLQWLGPLILAIVSTIAIAYCYLHNTGDFANIIILCVLYLFYCKCGTVASLRLKLYSGIGAVIVALVMVLGKLGKNTKPIINSLKENVDGIIKDAQIQTSALSMNERVFEIVIYFIMFIGLAILFYFCFLFLMERLTIKTDLKCIESKFKSTFWCSYIMILLLWMPYFWINYPGILTYDSINQIGQIEGDVVFSTVHSGIHTMLLGACYKFGKLIVGSTNVGIAVYSVIQMCILAAIYSYTIAVLRKYGINKKICILMVLYYAVLPIHAFYAVTIWKDILFSGFIVLFCICFFQYYVTEEKNKVVIFLMILSASLVILLRPNGIGAYSFFCIVLLLFNIKKIKKIAILIFPIIISFMINGPLYEAIGIQSYSSFGVTMIPIQQISRVAIECEDELESWEVEGIENLAPIEEIKAVYNSRLIDPVKTVIAENGRKQYVLNNKAEFFKFWVKLGLRHPIQYILSYLDITVGYWYPNIQYSVYGLGVMENNYGIHSVNSNNIKLWQTSNLYKFIPIYGNLFSIGGMVVSIICLSVIQLYLRLYKQLAIVLLPLGAWLTIMAAAPVFAEMRYVYYIMIYIPLHIGITILTVKINNRE